MKIRRNILIPLAAAVLSTASLFAQQPVAPEFTNAINDITQIARVSGTLVGGLVGLIGLGRTGWKLANGETDVMNSLIMAVVGIFLGAMANTFIV